jgi:hypothetical protein
MEQRLFLDRIDVKSARVRVRHRPKCAIAIHLVPAVTSIAGFEYAVVRANFALDVAVELDVVPCFSDPSALLPQGPYFVVRSVTPENVCRLCVTGCLP